jgi:membrane-associated phospholipid phosphatase
MATTDAAPEPIADPPHRDVPGQGAFGPTVDAFDQRVDKLLEQVRGNPIADKVFTTASHVGEFSLIWHAISITRGLIKGRRDQVVVLVVLIGAESLIVNQGVKRLFKRTRPTTDGDDRLKVRKPMTSSFPSGHASAAAFAATMLTAWDGKRTGTVWFTLAGVVGTSRAYVRIHHASDVVGGLVVGRILGLVGRRVARRILPA